MWSEFARQLYQLPPMTEEGQPRTWHFNPDMTLYPSQVEDRRQWAGPFGPSPVEPRNLGYNFDSGPLYGLTERVYNSPLGGALTPGLVNLHERLFDWYTGGRGGDDPWVYR